MIGSVYALAASGSDVYAGGLFGMMDGSAYNNIARWSGKTWSTLGSGVGGGHAIYPPVVRVLVVSGRDVYAGGDFTTAGGKASAYVARANIGGDAGIPAGGILQNIRLNAYSVTLDCVGVPASTYALQRAMDVRFTESLTIVSTTNAPADGQFRCIDPDPPSTTAFYRLLKQ